MEELIEFVCFHIAIELGHFQLSPLRRRKIQRRQLEVGKRSPMDSDMVD